MVVACLRDAFPCFRIFKTRHGAVEDVLSPQCCRVLYLIYIRSNFGSTERRVRPRAFEVVVPDGEFAL